MRYIFALVLALTAWIAMEATRRSRKTARLYATTTTVRYLISGNGSAGRRPGPIVTEFRGARSPAAGDMRGPRSEDMGGTERVVIQFKPFHA